MATTLFRRIALLPIDPPTQPHANSTHTEQRPTLFKLWRRYKFNTGILAIKARVPPGTVNAMLENHPVPRIEAEKVLGALSALLREGFTEQSVYVALISEKEKTHEHPNHQAV